MLYKGSEMEEQALLQTAARMCAAARTAPKTMERDMLHSYVLTGEEKEELAREMEAIATGEQAELLGRWYERDADNVRKAQAVVLLGVEKKSHGVPGCGYCGFSDCAACQAAGGNCAFSYVDLGVACSSAVIAAAMDMVDNRIMYSIGKAASRLSYGNEILWMGIPISVKGKNLFFDRRRPKK